MRLASILLALLFVLTASATAQTTLKVASLAPDGSLWMKEMRAAGEAVAQGSEGRVTIKFYPGGVMGNDATVLRKIRLGQLQGGAFTGSELSLVYKNAQIYSLPFCSLTMTRLTRCGGRWIRCCSRVSSKVVFASWASAASGSPTSWDHAR